jgi:hypothetical protein
MDPSHSPVVFALDIRKRERWGICRNVQTILFTSQEHGTRVLFLRTDRIVTTQIAGARDRVRARLSGHVVHFEQALYLLLYKCV